MHHNKSQDSHSLIYLCGWRGSCYWLLIGWHVTLWRHLSVMLNASVACSRFSYISHRCECMLIWTHMCQDISANTLTHGRNRTKPNVNDHQHDKWCEVMGDCLFILASLPLISSDHLVTDQRLWRHPLCPQSAGGSPESYWVRPSDTRHYYCSCADYSDKLIKKTF